MFETEKFTRTDETEDDYRERSINLLEKYAKETGKDWDIHPESLIDWLHDRRNACSPAYWRRTRAALSFFFENIGQQALVDAIKRISTEGCAPPTHTSAKKKKSVSDQELVELTNFLLAPGASKISVETYNFFISGIMTGMRPVEWSQSDLQIIPNSEDSVDEIQIVVQNAKATNGRAHGRSRTLLFRKLHPQEIDVLLDHWRSVCREVASGTFLEFQRRCSDKIRYAGHRLWPHKRKRISLYSGRHQSMANGKASGLPKNVIAAMHGHATDRTAGEHYGRKQFGNAGRVYAEVPDEEVARVREVAKDWNPPARTPTPTKS